MQLAQNTPIDLGRINGPTTAYQPTILGPDVTGARIQVELFLSNILGLVTVLAGLAFLLFFIFGTMQWILAGGDEGRVSNARKQMTNAGLGLIVTLISYSIMTIVSRVLGLDFLDINNALNRLNPL